MHQLRLPPHLSGLDGLRHGEGGEAQGHCLRLRLEHEEHAEIKEIVKIDLNKKFDLKFASILYLIVFYIDKLTFYEMTNLLFTENLQE